MKPPVAAFKEWAAVVAALGSGRQSIIFRKGGILEPGKRFAMEHREFFLFPTYEHQNAEDLTEEGRGYLKNSGQKPADIPIRFFAQVVKSVRLNQPDEIERLVEYHVWSKRGVEKKFAWGGEPGVFMMLLRIFRLENAVNLENKPEYSGCKSWILFEEGNFSAGQKPVLSDEEFSALSDKLKHITPGLEPV